MSGSAAQNRSDSIDLDSVESDYRRAPSQNHERISQLRFLITEKRSGESEKDFVRLCFRMCERDMPREGITLKVGASDFTRRLRSATRST